MSKTAPEFRLAWQLLVTRSFLIVAELPRPLGRVHLRRADYGETASGFAHRGLHSEVGFIVGAGHH
jgi:hypothetical protein